MGTIELHTSSGSLTLDDAFFVPDSAVRLISVFLLGNANYSSHFYPQQGHCFISNSENSIVAYGAALPNRKLFILSDFSVHIPCSHSTSSFAHYTLHPPGIDTWHKWLGHCSS
jgi:hypothetical protein